MLDEQPGFFLILPAVPFLKQIDAKTLNCKLDFPLNYLSTELFFFRTEWKSEELSFPGRNSKLIPQLKVTKLTVHDHLGP